jgi:sugar lactone lactonase YvrE
MRIVTLSADGRESIVAEGVQTHHLIVTKRNEVYFSLAPLHEVGMIDAMGKFRTVTNEVDWPHGLHILDNPPRMIVTDSKNGEVWTFWIQPDGSLADKAPTCRLEPHGKGSEIEAGGVTSDTMGDIYIATKIGIQICDAAGNIKETIPAPDSEGVSNLLFAGADFRWMYATNGSALYRRHLKRSGVHY